MIEIKKYLVRNRCNKPIMLKERILNAGESIITTNYYSDPNLEVKEILEEKKEEIKKIKIKTKL